MSLCRYADYIPMVEGNGDEQWREIIVYLVYWQKIIIGVLIARS